MKALLVILSVIGAVLAVALALLLIWRVLATIQVSMTSHQQRDTVPPRRPFWQSATGQLP